VHSSLPLYSGGLGILAGDHLKSASDLNLPLVAVGLFYGFGYFRQSVTTDDWQAETYKETYPDELPVELVTDATGAPVMIDVTLRGRVVRAGRGEQTSDACSFTCSTRTFLRTGKLIASSPVTYTVAIARRVSCRR